MGIKGWFGASDLSSDWLGDKNRPYGVESIIADHPASIVIDGLGSRTVAAQTVRIDLAGLSASEALSMGANALLSKQRLVVLGYKNHPTITDTDLQRGDEFPYTGQRYRVIKVESHFTDRIIAIAEALA